MTRFKITIKSELGRESFEVRATNKLEALGRANHILDEFQPSARVVSVDPIDEEG